MKPAKKPRDEATRLQALFAYNILDTDPEQRFDELTELVASICDVPISLVSLIDEKRQWFKSHHGLDATETPREFAFCAHAILGEEILEVPDSTQDERFFDNPLVTGEPKVIFYAGMPLITADGHKLGTLCAIDHTPKQLSQQQKRQLTIIAKQVVRLLELHKNTGEKESLFNELVLLTEQLNLKYDELNQFSSRIAHDLKGSLQQVNSFAELCSMDLNAGNTDDAKEKLGYLKSASTRLSHLVSDILTLARADISLEQITQVDLHQIASQALADLTASDNLPVAIGQVIDVKGDYRSEGTRIQQIIYNLVSNGIKYYNSEQTNPYVNLNISGNSEEICIVVSDNGLGIPEQYQPKVFDAFARFHPSVDTGSGFGTTLIKKHVDKLNGAIKFVSSEQGSTFTVVIPSCNSTKSI